MTDVVYRISLEDKDASRKIARIDRNIQRLADQGDVHFRSIGNSARLSGVQIGAVSGVVQELTQRFIELGLEAVRSIGNIISGSTEVAKEFQTTEAVFKGIFQGSEPIAVAVFDRLRAKSRELGFDITEIGKAFLPFVESVEQVEEAARLVPGLLAKSPDLQASDARRAIIEGLSGDFVSLRRAFEFDKLQVGRIKELQKELGNTEGLIKGLGDELKRLGLDVDSTADTLTRQFGRVRESGRDLQAALGEPIVDELTEQFRALGDVSETRSDDFELIASAFGDVVANVAKFTGTNLTDFLTNLDTDEAIELADNLFEMVESAKLLADALGLLEFPDSFLSTLDNTVEELNQILTTAVQIEALTRAQLAGEDARNEAIESFGKSPFRVRLALQFLTDEEEAQAAQAAQDAFNDVIAEAVEAFNQSNDSIEKNRQRLAARRAEQERSTETEDAFADALLASERRVEAITDAFATIETLEQEHQDKRNEIINDGVEKAIEAEIKASERREAIVRRSANRREAAELKFQQALEREALSDDETELIKRQGQEKLKLEQDIDNDRLDIERRFREQLQAIQTRFATSAEEAERNRDAIAFLQAERQRNQEVQAARQERVNRLAEAETEAQQRRDLLKQEQAFELEQLDSKNKERLQLLQLQLDQELERIQLQQRQQLDEADITERQKTEALEREIRRRLEAEKAANAEKLANFTATLDAEVAAVITSEKAKTAAVEKEAKKQAQILAKTKKKSSGGLSDELLAQTLGLTGKQDGGPVSANRPFLVGEAGPEIFVPQTAGNIIPNTQLQAQPLPQSVSNISSQVDRSLQVAQLNFGNSQDLIERLIAVEQAVETITRLRR